MQIGCKVFDAVLYSLSVKTAELNVQLKCRGMLQMLLYVTVRLKFCFILYVLQ